MKTTLHAQVRMTNIRQVEFEADPSWTVAQIDEAAKRQAIKEYGDADEIEVEDFDHSPLRREEGE